MRLVDADTLKTNLVKVFIDKFEGNAFDAIVLLENTIDDAPTVDAIEVVRCKDCLFHGGAGCHLVDYNNDGSVEDPTGDDDYCSWGERKDDNT